MADLSSNNVVTSRRISAIINGVWSKISGKYATITALEEESARATGVEDGLSSDISQNSASINAINALIPDEASSTNQLADKAYVDSEIGQVAAKYLSSDEDGNPFTSYASFIAGPYYYDGEVVTPTKNDYVLVNGDETHDNNITRYWYTGRSWSFQYVVNNSPFTESEWGAIRSGITAAKVSTYDGHVSRTDNPHEVTKAQIGLGNVDNTSDANKPISTATQNALNGKQNTISDLNEIRDGAAAGATAVQPSDLAGYVNKTGDTMTGMLTVQNAGGDPAKYDEGAIVAKMPAAGNRTGVSTNGSVFAGDLNNTNSQFVGTRRKLFTGNKVAARFQIFASSATPTASQGTAAFMQVDYTSTATVKSIFEFGHDYGTNKDNWGTMTFGSVTKNVAYKEDFDTALNDSSISAPQTKVVYESINGKQDAISDLATIRSNAANGNTAYGWGNHANAGYIDGVDSDSTTVFTDSTTIVVGRKSGSKLLVRTATALWTYIKGKADAVYSALGHTHTKSDITDFPTSLPADGGDAYRLYSKRNAMPDGTAITNLNNFYQLGKVMFGEFQGSSVSNCPVDNWVLVESRCGNDTTIYVTQIATRMTGNMSGTTETAANGDMWVRTCNGGMWTSWVKYVKPSDITTNGRIFYRSLSQLSLTAPVAYHQVLEAMPNNSELVMWNNSSTFTDYPSTVAAGIIHFIRGADLGAANIEAFGRNYGDHYVAKITSSASSTTCTVDAWYKMSKDGHSHGQIASAGAIYQAGQVDIANGDRLVIVDASDNSLLKRSSNTFDGSTVSQYLSRKGTFEDMPTELPAAGGVADTIKMEPFSQAGVNLDTILGENYRVKWYRWASDKKPSGITYTGCLEVIRYDNLIVQNVYYLNQPGYHMARYYVDGVWQSWIKVIDKPTASDVGALAANGKAASATTADSASNLIAVLINNTNDLDSLIGDRNLGTYRWTSSVPINAPENKGSGFLLVYSPFSGGYIQEVRYASDVDYYWTRNNANTNWTKVKYAPTASDVGALAANGKAVDSAKADSASQLSRVSFANNNYASNSWFPIYEISYNGVQNDVCFNSIFEYKRFANTDRQQNVTGNILFGYRNSDSQRNVSNLFCLVYCQQDISAHFDFRIVATNGTATTQSKAILYCKFFAYRWDECTISLIHALLGKGSIYTPSDTSRKTVEPTGDAVVNATWVDDITGNAATATTLANRIVFSSSSTPLGYYKIGELAASSNLNHNNVRIIGKLGSWESGGTRVFDINIGNRSGITINGFSSRSYKSIDAYGDIVVYTNTDGKCEIYYQRKTQYTTFEADVFAGDGYTHTWTGTLVTPSGTQSAALSTAPEVFSALYGNAAKAFGYQNGSQYHIKVTNTGSTPKGWCSIARVTKTSGYADWTSVRIIGKFYYYRGNWESTQASYVDFQAIINIVNNTAKLLLGKSDFTATDYVRLVKVADRDYELQFNAKTANEDYDVYYQVEGNDTALLYLTPFTTYTATTVTGTAITAEKMMANGSVAYEADHADTARVASMLGSDNVGNVSTPIYLYQGVPNQCLKVAADTVDGWHISVDGATSGNLYFV